MLRQSSLLPLQLVLLSSTHALAEGYTVRCNREQSLCEVDTKRLTRGDRVGIFDEDNNIVATGTVTSLKERVRIFKVDKRFNQIYRDHKLRFLSDQQADNPLKFFTKAREDLHKQLGVGANLTSVGIGDGLMATGIDAFYDYRLFGKAMVVGRFFYLRGAWTASNSDVDVTDAAITFSSFGLLGGVALPLIRTRLFGVRGEVSIGFASTTLTTDSSRADGPEIVENKVGGTGFAAKAELDAVYQLGSVNPYAGLSYFKLQNSNCYTFNFGALIEL